MDSNGDNEPGPSKRRKVEAPPTSDTENISDERRGIVAPQNEGITLGTNEEEQESPNVVISGGEFDEVQFGKKRNQASMKLLKHIEATTTHVRHYGPDDELISSSTSQQSVEESESMSFEGSGDNPQKVQKLMEQALATANEDLAGIIPESSADYRRQLHSNPSNNLSRHDESTAPKRLKQGSELASRHLQCQTSGANNSNENDETIAIRSGNETPNHQLEPSMQTSRSGSSMAGTVASPSAAGELQLQHEPEQSPTVVTGGNFGRVHIGPQSNQQIIESHLYLTRQENHHYYYQDSAQEKHSPEKCAEFLNRVKTNFNKTDHSTNDRNFVVRPTMMLADMERKKQGNASSVVFDKTDTLFGRDIKQIDLNELFDEHNNKIPRHVMMLGDLGAGKTTLSSTFAESVNDGKVDNMKNIELVHFVRASNLQTDSPSTAFDLIFTDQIAGGPETDLNGLREAGQYWLQKNSDKLLLVIDGLDQFKDGLHQVNKNINYSTKAKADVILANIMSGNIWFGAKIMTTSRWLVYSKLKPDQRPNKVVALRGFDDESMEEAARNLVSNTDSQDDICTYLSRAEPGLRSLCKNPMFLSYAAEVFQENPTNLPENLSGLMAAVFLKFVRSTHYGLDANLENLTKLAYHGMMDNKFSFTENYIRNLRINPETLEGPIVSSASLQPGPPVAIAADQKYSFSHQSMQELFAALHLFRLNREEVQELVSDRLNSDSMEMLRKLFYGMVMNEKTRERLTNFIEDLSCSPEECQEIILNQFRSFFSDGIINGIEIVSLLCECGPGIIAKLEVDISEIQIGCDGFYSDEELALVAVIPQCAALKSVQFGFLELGPKLLKELQQLPHAEIYVEELQCMDNMLEDDLNGLVKFLDTAKYAEIDLQCSDESKKALLSHWSSAVEKLHFGTLTLTGKSSVETFQYLSQFLGLFRLNVLVLCQTECTEEKLEKLNFELEEFSPQIQYLTLDDEDLPPERYNDLATTIKKLGCSELQLQNCKLSAEKLRKFGSKCKEEEIEMQCLAIQDEDLDPEGFSELAMTVGKAHCLDLRLQDCDLTAEKLATIGSRCEDENIKIQCLAIQDEDLTPDGFGELARTFGKVCCSTLHLQDCELSAEKLMKIGNRCLDENIKIQCLVIQDVNLTSEDYGELAKTAGKTRCLSLLFQDCDLSIEKLKAFGKKCQDEKIHIQCLAVQDEDLTPDGLSELAMSVEKTHSWYLRLQECRLSAEKLAAIGSTCQKESIKIQCLVIQDKDLTLDDFCELVMTVSKTSCSDLRLQNCGLSVEMLQEFASKCQDENIKVEYLTIEDRDLTPEGFGELAVTASKSNTPNLRLQSCELSVEKLQIFGNKCQDKNIKVNSLAIEDQDLTTQGFGELAMTVGKSNCSDLCLQNCKLSVEKLQIFGSKCKDDNIVTFLPGSFLPLAIEDDDLTPEGFGELAVTVNKSNCSELHLRNCRLSVEKLQILGGRCQDEDIQVTELTVQDQDLTPDGFSELAATVGKICSWNLFLLNCSLSVEKLMAFGDRCQDDNIGVQSLTIEDQDLTLEGFGYLAVTVKKSTCSYLSLQNCGLSVEKLTKFGSMCNTENIQVESLTITEGEVEVTDEMISVLCELMHDVVEELNINGWQLDEEGRNRLKSAFSSSASLVKCLQLPGEDMLQKRRITNPDGSVSWIDKRLISTASNRA